MDSDFKLESEVGKGSTFSFKADHYKRVLWQIIRRIYMPLMFNSITLAREFERGQDFFGGAR